MVTEEFAQLVREAVAAKLAKDEAEKVLTRTTRALNDAETLVRRNLFGTSFPLTLPLEEGGFVTVLYSSTTRSHGDFTYIVADGLPA